MYSFAKKIIFTSLLISGSSLACTSLAAPTCQVSLQSHVFVGIKVAVLKGGSGDGYFAPCSKGTDLVAGQDCEFAIKPGNTATVVAYAALNNGKISGADSTFKIKCLQGLPNPYRTATASYGIHFSDHDAGLSAGEIGYKIDCYSAGNDYVNVNTAACGKTVVY